jgi:predicted RND superfamily exporter protein
MHQPIIQFAVNKPKIIFTIVLVATLLLGAMIPRIHIDTDPENMLPENDPARITHQSIKDTFNLHDMIVLGLVNDTDPNGVFNKLSLSNIHYLSQEIQKIDGVIDQDLMSLATVDNILQEGPGTIRFQWMMAQPPQTDQEIDVIKSASDRLPLIKNTLVSGDHKATAIVVPIRSKHESHRIASEIEALLNSVDKTTGDQFHITGLPVAEDTFGIEMFKQMAISAPAAGVLIFVLMWFFFRSLPLITAPMLMSMATVVISMGLLIGSGFTVHIMSSMIPIFLMPIAVVDSVHILSEFADRYKPGMNSKKLISEIMDHLFKPMLFTSLTSSAGFASLLFTPIPPVQVFGAFVAFGILLAFVLTIIFIPAYIASLSDKTLERMANRVHQLDTPEQSTLLGKVLVKMGSTSLAHAKLVVISAATLLVISGYGLSKIEVNDNPVKWFEESHAIRVADKVLNEHFAGTYNAFIALEHKQLNLAGDINTKVAGILKKAKESNIDISNTWANLLNEHGKDPAELAYQIDEKSFNANEAEADYWLAILDVIEQEITASQYFLNPKALAYIEKMQAYLIESNTIGKSNALPDLVKTVYRELKGGDDSYYKLPDNSSAVAQTLLSFQGSHRPDDLWRMVTPNYRSTVLWLQLPSGDNQDMIKAIDAVNAFIQANPLPEGVTLNWGGLTYINVVWQDVMVKGMIGSLLSAFVAVFIIMVILFRSILFGTLAMIPLTVTIAFIYGVIGFIGKDYDMPVAVLSSLTLGLSIDFAIHFIQRTRDLVEETGSWSEAMVLLFEEPARAISRNAIVIALGFLPLLLSPLLPYQTVGIFLAAIMAVSCLITLLVLPTSMQLLKNKLFKNQSN